MKIIALVLGALALLTGCGGIPYSDPHSSPDTSRGADCAKIGGTWHPETAVCEGR